jgi:CBS domain-containing protein
MKTKKTIELFTKKTSDFLSQNYLCVDQNETVLECVKKAVDQNKETILVKNDKDKICGIVTLKDIFKKFVVNFDQNVKIESIMSSPVIYVGGEDLLFHAVGVMRKNNFTHIPVLNQKRKIIGILNMADALSAELGSTVSQIDELTQDEDDVQGLINIKKYQPVLVESLLNQSVAPLDIAYLLSFLNNLIYLRAVTIAKKNIAKQFKGFKPPKFSVITMGSGGRMESFLHPDQDNGIIYLGDETKETDQYFEELSKHFTKTLDDCDIPFCKGNLMASNPLWRHSLQGWKDQLEDWTKNLSQQSMRYIEMLYDFRSVYGDPSLADELRKFLLNVLDNKYLQKFMYKNEENSDAGLNFFGNFVLEKDDEENKGLFNLKHTGTLPLVESIRLYAIKYQIEEISTQDRLEKLRDLEVFTENEYDFFSNAHKFLSLILLRNQFERAKQNLSIKNFIDVYKLTDREARILKMYLKRIQKLKDKVRVDFSEEYF